MNWFRCRWLVYGFKFALQLSHPPEYNTNRSIVRVHKRKTTIAIYGNFGQFRTNKLYTYAFLRRSAHRMEIASFQMKNHRAIYLIAYQYRRAHT